MIEPALHEAVAAATGVASLDAASAVGGGCINRCYEARRGTERWFVKLNDAAFEDNFAAEADGLAALAAAGVRVPVPHAHGSGEHGAWLVLEWLPLGEPDASAFCALGEALGALHVRPRRPCGWHRDNYIGATPQRNAWDEDPVRFWIQCRLAPQLELARRKGHAIDADAALEGTRRVLSAHRPPLALLHGDLWRGNAGCLVDGTPVLFDPAVSIGDPDADLAMTELFGGFPSAFYRAYRAVRSAEPGYDARRDAYNLYHVLNHLNLFGGGYLAQARRIIARLASA